MRIRGLAIVSSSFLVVCASPDRSEREAVDASFLARAQEQIAAREYRASENGQGLQAPNRAHNLRTYFDKTGIRVHDRTAEGSPELLQLTLAGVGRGEALAAVEPGAAPVTDGDRVEIHRPGLVEWYLNTEAGLEQGFTLAERPRGEGPLVVELAVAGARPTLVGDAVIFESEEQRPLRYGELVANDADGKVLPAHLELSGDDRLRIAVDDADAAYPIVIDPLLTATHDLLLFGTQTSSQFGISVAGAGDVNGDGYADVIVGASGYDDGQSNEGAAFVFHGSASGIIGNSPATANAALTSDLSGIGFGISVAGAGDVNGDGYADVIVGASGYSAGAGAAFVFYGSGTGIVGINLASAHQLTCTQVSTSFGFSVAGAGDVNADGFDDVVVGAWLYDNGQTDEGAAFVFRGSASGVGTRTQLAANTQLESNQANAAFGFSVAGAGDVNSDGYADVIVGAQWYEVNPPFTPPTEGAAFVYHGGAGGMVLDATIGGGQADMWFGRSVAGAGDVNGDGFADVIVGAPFFDFPNVPGREGAAWVFEGNPGGVVSQVASAAFPVLIGDEQADAQFGNRVAGAGDVNGDGYADVIVATSLNDSAGTDTGVAFVYPGTAAGISAVGFARLQGNQPSREFASGVAGAGDVNGDGYADVIVGAQFYDAATAVDGAAFVYHGGGRGTGFRTVDVSSHVVTGGNSVASAGDVNGDGYGDVIVGTPFYDNGSDPNEGWAWVFHGSASGIIVNDYQILESNREDARFGSSVAGAGDVNGDGYGDVIVGAPYYGISWADSGAAFVFLGSASGVAGTQPSNAHATLGGDQLNGHLGSDVDSAGDVNGDGYADVIVGAYTYSHGQSSEGAAFVFHGSGTGIGNRTSATPDALLESDDAFAYFGNEVAGAGDVNGDGYSDVIVGATQNYGAGEAGAVFVFPGSASGIADGNPGSIGVTQLESGPAGNFWGVADGAGDVNGDGYGDLIAGGHTGGQNRVFVFNGGTSGIADGDAGTASATILGQGLAASLGGRVAGAGDLNGDGNADVLAAAPNYGNGQTREGAVFVFHGSAFGIASGDALIVANGRIEGGQDELFFGIPASAGDVNGDGYADVIVGAPSYDYLPVVDQGAAFLFLGNGGGRSVLAQQRRADGTGDVVQPWGKAESATVEFRASHPAGTGLVRGQFEACPTGVPFGSGSCTTALSPTWEPVGLIGFEPDRLLPHTFTGLSSNMLYRWRARVQYAPLSGPIATNPFHSPWRRLGAQSVEADIRLPEPGVLLSLVSGFALVSALSLRRSRPVR